MSAEISVVLAAGVGTRLRPLTDRTNKCLLSVAGRAILRRSLEAQAAFGIREAIVVTGWRAAEVRAAVQSWRLPLELRFVDNPDFDETNNEYSLHLAARFVSGHEFLLHDADIVMDRAVLAHVLDAPGGCALALRRAPDLGDEEMKAAVDARGRVTAIGKHLPPRQAAGEVPGVTRFDPAGSARLFATVADRVQGRGLRTSWYEAAMAEMIAAGVDFRAVDIGDAYLAEVDTADDLDRVDLELRVRRAHLSLVAPERAASPAAP